MKQLLIILLAVATLAACKKESSGPKDIYLKKVSTNGEPETEYVYNSQGRLIEEKGYNNNALAYKYEYHYDNNGNLLEALGYDMPENILVDRSIYTLNAQGMIVRRAIWNTAGADSGKISFYIDHEYKEGRLVKQTWRDEDETEGSYRQLGYYPNGNLRTSESYWVFGGVADKKWGSNYGPSDTTLPATIHNAKVYPVNFYTTYLLSSYINNYGYDNGAVDEQTQEVISGRKFNSRGLITEETITTKHIKPVSADEVRTMKFEYVEL